MWDYWADPKCLWAIKPAIKAIDVNSVNFNINAAATFSDPPVGILTKTVENRDSSPLTSAINF